MMTPEDTAFVLTSARSAQRSRKGFVHRLLGKIKITLLPSHGKPEVNRCQRLHQRSRML